MHESGLDETGPVTVLIVEDHEMVATGFSAVLNAEPDMEVVGWARTAGEGLGIARELKPDVVLMDYRLPDADGASTAAKLRADLPGIAVLLVTGVETEAAVAAALDAGCAGFVSKGRGVAELAGAIRAAAAGAAVFPTELLASVARHGRDSGVTGHDLTAREREVLQMLAEGRGTADIAAALVVSMHTVRNHVRNILTKLDARTKLEAVVVAARSGLVEVGRTP